MEILGIDIGGTGIKGAIVDTSTGEIKSERVRLLTPQPATPDAIADTVFQLVKQIGFDGPIACGFPSRVIHGVVKTAANIDKSWINVPVEELFSKRLERQVYVANDADVAALAELHFGAAKDVSGTVLVLTLGTGIGSCLFVNGTFCPNTELGHIVFHGDSAERYCSGAVKERENIKWKEWGERLNEYLEYVAFLLQPDLIVLGGGASKKFEKYAEVLNSDLNIKPAQMLNLAGIVGAGMYGELRIKQS
ncbi:MAG: ROK family protein [Succinatimonas sp.]|nr:ROK family protein [Succinatimonas sp.]